MKVVTIIGARPQFIKAATVSREFKKYAHVKEVIIHTGQHFDANMSDIFFTQMDIPKPDYMLAVSGLSHGAMTGRMLEEIEEKLIMEKPDWVLVYGDTNSTLAGALAASKLHIKIAHVEAGLRSYNMRMPEEQNRIITDRLSCVLFCPTNYAMENLDKEGYSSMDIDIVNVGDVMQDAAMFYADKVEKPKEFNDSDLSTGFVLSTIHRAENTDSPDRLTSIVDAINKINKNTPVILPLHPRTRGKIKEYGLTLDAKVIEPVGYLEMLFLLKNCSLVVCDSGGLQKEAFFFNKPCITMRDETEWVELVDSGVNLLTGANSKNIVDAYKEANSIQVLDDGSLYGGGNASARIVKYIVTESNQV